MLYERGNKYWVKFKHNGKREQIPLDLYTSETSVAEARKAARKKQADFEAEHGPGRVRQKRTDTIPLAVLEELDAERIARKGLGDRRPETIANLWAHVLRILKPERDIRTLTINDVDAYEGKRREEGVRGQTIRREVQTLTRGLRLAKRSKLIDRLPFDLIDIERIESDPAKVQQEGKLWPTSVILTVFDALSAKAKTAGYPQMLRLIMSTGLRMEEFRRCNETWIKPAQKGSGAYAMLNVPAADVKIGDPRELPLSKDGAATIRELGHTFGWRKFNHALHIACVKVGVAPNVTPRDLRTWYLSTAGELDPVAAQKLGGHANIATTGLYLDAGNARAIKAGVSAIRVLQNSQKGLQRKGLQKNADRRIG